MGSRTPFDDSDDFGPKSTRSKSTPTREDVQVLLAEQLAKSDIVYIEPRLYLFEQHFAVIRRDTINNH